MEILYKFFHLVGSFVCHQEISKTLKISGLPLPVCARCSGIYSGILFSFLYVFFLKKHSKTINKKFIFFFSFIIFLLLLNIAGAILKIWEPSNYSRLFFGLYGATGIGFFISQIFSYFRFEKFKNIDKKDIFSLLVFPLLIFLFLIIISFPSKIYYFFWASILIISIFSTYFIVNYVLAISFLKRKSKFYKLKFTILLITLFFFEFTVLYISHNF